jgi:hypothetical protein
LKDCPAPWFPCVFNTKDLYPYQALKPKSDIELVRQSIPISSSSSSSDSE